MAELGNRDGPRADAAHDGEEVAEVVVVAVGDQGNVEGADVTQPRRAERVAVSPRVNDDLAPLRAGQPECRMPEEGHLSATGGTHVPHGPGLGGGRQGGRPITVLTRCKRPAAGRERGADVDHDNAQLAALRLTVPGQPKCSWEHEMMTGARTTSRPTRHGLEPRRRRRGQRQSRPAHSRHASAAITLDIYAGLFDGDLDAVADRLDQAATQDADPVRTRGPGGRG